MPENEPATLIVEYKMPSAKEQAKTLAVTTAISFGAAAVGIGIITGAGYLYEKYEDRKLRKLAKQEAKK